MSILYVLFKSHTNKMNRIKYALFTVYNILQVIRHLCKHKYLRLLQIYLDCNFKTDISKEKKN